MSDGGAVELHGRRIVDVDKLSEEGSTVSLVQESIQPSCDAGVSEVSRDE